MTDVLLTGWGRTAPSRARVHELDPAQVAALVGSPGPRGLIARGLGRSYNDAAQNGGGDVLRLRPGPPVRLDVRTGLVSCPAGTELDALIDHVVPLGWFVPVTPGTSQVTIGGMLAADVHGKNHHRDGSIGEHVRSLEIVTPAGGLQTLTPEGPTAGPFWATIGGMGLTGVITTATLQLIPVTSARIRAEDRRLGDLEAVMGALVAADQHRYSVAWVDGTARGAHLGRGIVSTGEHAQAGEVSTPDPLRLRPVRHVTVPVTPPLNPLNRWSITAFNEAWYRRPGTGGRLADLRSFFHPLDSVGAWNRLYGRQGFVQYQFVVPDDAATLVRDALAALQRIGAASFLAVLKRFGPGNRAGLSFPLAGWTLALDVPAGVDGLARVLDGLDERVAAAGGRLYLAKDARMRPALLPTMYPRLDQWRSIRDLMDPERVMVSDLARRLGP